MVGVFMYKTTVVWHSREEAHRFVQLCSSQPFSIDLSDGDCVVHAQSIIGVLSLPMGEPLTLSVEKGDEKAIAAFDEQLKPFLYEKKA